MLILDAGARARVELCIARAVGVRKRLQFFFASPVRSAASLRALVFPSYC